MLTPRASNDIGEVLQQHSGQYQHAMQHQAAGGVGSYPMRAESFGGVPSVVGQHSNASYAAL